MHTELPALPRYALVSFDLDGTLLDSAAEIAEAVNRALHEQGLPRQPAAELTLLIGHGARRLLQDVLARQAATGLQAGGRAQSLRSIRSPQAQRSTLDGMRWPVMGRPACEVEVMARA
jgi:phosphoglycolate phosphatase-like HAD superfamily hydrolase